MLTRTSICRGLGLAVFATIASSCAGQGKQLTGSSGNLIAVAAESLPQPSAADYGPSDSAFVIGPYDIIDVAVYGIEDMQLENIQVDASGRFTFPLIGTVNAAGNTPGQLADVVAASLRRSFLRDPKVIVNIKETASKTFSIGGEVKRPGIYQVTNGMTLLKTIARAEGWTEFAKKREVLIFRKVDGKQYVALYNAAAIEKGNYADPEILSDDNIVVGDSQAKRNLKNVYSVVPSLLAPLIFLLDSNN